MREKGLKKGDKSSDGVQCFALPSYHTEPYHHYGYGSTYDDNRHVTATTSHSYERHQENCVSHGGHQNSAYIQSARKHHEPESTGKYCDNDYDLYKKLDDAERNWGYHGCGDTTQKYYDAHRKSRTGHMTRSVARYNPYKKVTYKDGKAESFYDIKYKSPLFRLYLSEQTIRFQCKKSQRQCKRGLGEY